MGQEMVTAATQGVGFGVGQKRTGVNRRREGRRQTTFVELTAGGLCFSTGSH